MRFKKFAAKLDMVQDDVAGTPKIAPSADRDVTYPKEPVWHTTIPADISLADDQDATTKLVTQIQQSLKGGLLGVKYSGPVDGNVNSSLFQAISELEQALETKFPRKKFLGSIRFGTLLSASGWNKALKAIGELKKDEPKAQEPSSGNTNPNQEIIEFQKLFGLAATGIIDQALIQKAIETEKTMISTLQEPAISGMIWNPTAKNFQTSAADVAQALKIMSQHQKK